MIYILFTLLFLLFCFSPVISWKFFAIMSIVLVAFVLIAGGFIDNHDNFYATYKTEIVSINKITIAHSKATYIYLVDNNNTMYDISKVKNMDTKTTITINDKIQVEYRKLKNNKYRFWTALPKEDTV